MNTYTVTIVKSETWTFEVKAKAKHFAEEKAKEIYSKEKLPPGVTIDTTDLWIGVEKKK